MALTCFTLTNNGFATIGLQEVPEHNRKILLAKEILKIFSQSKFV